MWGLVVACARPDSGPAAKMRGYAAAFERLGVPTRCEVINPDRTTVPRTAALLRPDEQPLGHGVILLRSHWSLPPLLPMLAVLRARGHTVVIDCPTPTAAGLKEVAGSGRGVLSRTLRLGNEAIWTPLAWTSASVLVQYADDGPPWRGLARNRRLSLTNGVDVAGRPINDAWPWRSGMVFVCAGAIGPWHGLDRLLLGMSAVDDASRLLVVGVGPDTERLMSLVKSQDLTDRVEFYGPRSGAQYDALIEQADVGVASLAEHRRGSYPLSPLKTRDYLARGMPVLFAGDDPDLRQDLDFCYRAADDNSPIPVAGVSQWLSALRQKIQADDAIGPEGIREFATAHLDLGRRAQVILNEAVRAAASRPPRRRPWARLTGGRRREPLR